MAGIAEVVQDRETTTRVITLNLVGFDGLVEFSEVRSLRPVLAQVTIETDDGLERVDVFVSGPGPDGVRRRVVWPAAAVDNDPDRGAVLELPEAVHAAITAATGLDVGGAP